MTVRSSNHSARSVVFRLQSSTSGVLNDPNAEPPERFDDLLRSRRPLPALNTCQVPASRCCPTPGFDQSHTPAGKILRSRAISSAVNVALVVGRAQRLQLALDDIVRDRRPCDAARERERRIQIVALPGAVLLLLDDSPAASRPCSSRRRRDPRAWRGAASQSAHRSRCPATGSSATGPSARAPGAARGSRCRSRRSACPGAA